MDSLLLLPPRRRVLQQHRYQFWRHPLLVAYLPTGPRKVGCLKTRSASLKRDGFAPRFRTASAFLTITMQTHHKALNQSHGPMLKSHNATLLSVTWMETLPICKPHRRAFENLNMTHGRVITLNDNGIIRTALGHTTVLESILDSFNDFRGQQLQPSCEK